MNSASYPRRQRNRRLVRAVQEATVAMVALLLAALAASLGLSTIAVLFILAGGAWSISSRHWWRLARRSDVGARSEDRVRSELRRLDRQGWRIRHSLPCQGGGDVDHLAVVPTQLGTVFAIETKTRSYSSADLARISAIARWQAQRLSGRRRGEAIALLCLARRRGIERWEDGVAVVSLDRLVPVMCRLAGTTPKPAFLR